jgi:hypothetical protein
LSSCLISFSFIKRRKKNFLEKKRGNWGKNIDKICNYNIEPPTGGQRYRTQSGPAPASIRPFGSGSSDEDPYSVAGSGSSGSSGANIIQHATGRAQIPPPGKSVQVPEGQS